MGAGYVGECTWYAWGRANEVTGQTSLPNAGAGSWYSKASGFTKYGTTEVPQDRSIGCFSGHVVYIETVSKPVSGEPQITFSECNWYNDGRLSNGKVETPPNGTDGQLKVATLSEFKGRGGYQGCIKL